MKNFTLTLFLFTILLYGNTFAQSTASYNITFESIWESVFDNATDGQSTIPIPGSAHWSPLVITTHKTANTFFMMGAAATSGIEEIAETGGTSIFQNEVESNADANQFLNGGGLSTAKGFITVNNVSVSEDFPFISLASMIAPSPDWFIGVNSENLRSGNSSVNGGWKGTYTLDLFPYDAGTEEGNGYSINNIDTANGVITSRSNITPFNTNKIGTITFTYNSSTLSTNSSSNIANIKTYPNPAKTSISITNLNNIQLKNIEVYNVIGNLVKQNQIEQQLPTITLNVSNLNKGLYFLKLNTIEGSSKTQKIVIN